MRISFIRSGVKVAAGAALLLALWVPTASGVTTATSDIDGIAAVTGSAGDDRITLLVQPPTPPEPSGILRVQDPAGATTDACVQVSLLIVDCDVGGTADVFGSAGNDTIDFSYAPGAQRIELLALIGGDGNDDIRGSDMDDAELNGGPGDDVIDGRGGADFIDCGEGTDTVVRDALDTVNPGCELVTEVILPQTFIPGSPSASSGGTAAGPAAPGSAPPSVRGAASGTATVSAAGTFTLKQHVIECPAGGSSCKVTTAVRRKSARFGGSSYTLAPGKRAGARVKLTRKGLRLLRRAKRITATVTIAVAKGAQVAAKQVRVTLRAPKRK